MILIFSIIMIDFDCSPKIPSDVSEMKVLMKTGKSGLKNVSCPISPPRWLTLALIGITPLFLPLRSQADQGGGWSSGGGNAVVCFHRASVARAVRRAGGVVPNSALRQIRSVEVLDLYEAKGLRDSAGNPHVLIGLGGIEGQTEPAIEYVGRLAARFRYSLPEMEELIRGHLEDFPHENVILHNGSLHPIRDIGSSPALPDPRCVLSTLATQQSLHGTNYLHLDSRLFLHANHSELSKAVLLLHEVLYRHSIMRGESTSQSVRQVIGELITRSPDQTVASLRARFRELGFLGPQFSASEHSYPILEDEDFERRFSTYPERITIQMMEVLGTEAGRLYDHFTSENQGEITAIRSSFWQHRSDIPCGDLFGCLAAAALPTTDARAIRATAFLGRQESFLREGLRRFVASTLAARLTEDAHLPVVVRAGILESLVAYGDYLAEQSRHLVPALHGYQGYRTSYVMTYNILRSRNERLAGERVVFYLRQGLPIPLDYSIDAFAGSSESSSAVSAALEGR